MVPFEATFVTGDTDGAGTSANLGLIIYGSHGVSPEYPIEKVANRFERGAQDLVKVYSL